MAAIGTAKLLRTASCSSMVRSGNRQRSLCYVENGPVNREGTANQLFFGALTTCRFDSGN